MNPTTSVATQQQPSNKRAYEHRGVGEEQKRANKAGASNNRAQVYLRWSVPQREQLVDIVRRRFHMFKCEPRFLFGRAFLLMLVEQLCDVDMMFLVDSQKFVEMLKRKLDVLETKREQNEQQLRTATAALESWLARQNTKTFLYVPEPGLDVPVQFDLVQAPYSSHYAYGVAHVSVHSNDGGSTVTMPSVGASLVPLSVLLRFLANIMPYVDDEKAVAAMLQHSSVATQEVCLDPCQFKRLDVITHVFVPHIVRGIAAHPGLGLFARPRRPSACAPPLARPEPLTRQMAALTLDAVRGVLDGSDPAIVEYAAHIKQHSEEVGADASASASASAAVKCTVKCDNVLVTYDQLLSVRNKVTSAMESIAPDTPLYASWRTCVTRLDDIIKSRVQFAGQSLADIRRRTNVSVARILRNLGSDIMMVRADRIPDKVVPLYPLVDVLEAVLATDTRPVAVFNDFRTMDLDVFWAIVRTLYA